MPNQWTENKGRTAESRRISIRLSPAEDAQLQQLVAAAKTTESEYVRARLGLKAPAVPALGRRAKRQRPGPK